MRIKFSISLIFMVILSKTCFCQFANQVIDFTTSIKIDKGKLIIERSYLIQISDKQSDWISDIEIPYNINDKLEILEASIINAKGEVVRTLNKKEIITKSDISHGTFFEDNLVKEFKLKWNEYPYRIKYSYRKSMDKFIHVCNWFPVLYTNVFTKKALLQVEIPFNYEVRINFTGNPGYVVDTLKDSYQHRWLISNVAPIVRETFSPPYQELIPRVMIVPQVFHYGKMGSFDSWATYGYWQEQMNEGLDVLPQSEGIKINDLIKGITDKKEIVKILYHYLQDHTRYVNVAIDVGGLKPYPASYVAENKYGDCKALTIYMKALLNHVNIPSYYTKIFSGTNPIIVDENLPAQQFNHVILCVPLEGDTLWLENTADYIPYNYLGTFTQDRYALLVDGKNSKLVKTPKLSLDDVAEVSSYKFELDKLGAGIVNIMLNLKGNSFEEYRSIEYNLSERDQRVKIESDLLIRNFKLVNWSFKQTERDDNRIEVDLELNVKEQLRSLGKSLILRPVDLKGINIDLENVESRRTAVRINYPINRTDSLYYNMEHLNNYQITLPENVMINSKFGTYAEYYALKDDQITMIRNFQLYSGHYTVDEYSDVYSFINSVKQTTQQSVIIFNPL